MNDKYTWLAVYNDNTSLPQINPDGSKNAYADIDRNKLSSFEIYEGDKRVLSIPFTTNQRLIWRRRIETAPGTQGKIVHIIGKQETINGENRQAIIALYEDGHTEISDRWDEAHPWFFPVQMIPEEGENG